jgi:SAM-dependent methyltransferase
MNEELDIAALESIAIAKNYNSYLKELFFLNIDKNDNILDFGAGFGIITIMLDKLGFNIVAVEKNKKAIQELSKKKIKTFTKIEDVQDNIDCIISLNVLEHIEDDNEIVVDFYNFLPKGGKLLLYLPASNIIWTDLDNKVNHKRRYQKKDLKKLLISNNFQIEELYFVDFIGWAVLLISRILRINLNFDKRSIKFYDKYIFKSFKFLDIFTKNVIGKNLFVIATKG